MRKRFIGPANPGESGEDLGHEVNVAGRYIGTVRPGEVLEVPDELLVGTGEDPAPVWSPELWEDVEDVNGSPKKKSEGESE